MINLCSNLDSYPSTVHYLNSLLKLVAELLIEVKIHVSLKILSRNADCFLFPLAIVVL